MGSLGWHNPMPLELGGGETAVERIYYAMRSAAGKGGSAEDDDGTIEGLWRQCRARAFGAVGTFGERSALQAFPDRATDALAYYESLLALTNPSLSDHERRQAAAQRYALQIASDLPSIDLALKQIDSRFSIVTPNPDESTVTIGGRAFEDYEGSLAFGGGRKSTLLPNYSTDFVFYVLLDLGGGVVPSAAERLAMDAARKLLADVLPGHNDFRIVTHRGFTLDVDLLDLTSFGA